MLGDNINVFIFIIIYARLQWIRYSRTLSFSPSLSLSLSLPVYHLPFRWLPSSLSRVFRYSFLVRPSLAAIIRLCELQSEFFLFLRSSRRCRYPTCVPFERVPILCFVYSLSVSFYCWESRSSWERSIGKSRERNAAWNASRRTNGSRK